MAPLLNVAIRGARVSISEKGPASVTVLPAESGKRARSVKDEALGHRETVTFCVIIQPTKRDRLYLSFSAEEILLTKVVGQRTFGNVVAPEEKK
ncbi:hypothetical protein NPIL_679261 [Nephila pilipes]|uniref:Uncharacterized protein n=1 Tax=Nephila pilipes TaxID=299642 RepID=A0A8X6NMJ7_NEPPI|nr:hypothetical protein NPIL_679261 [Nephila pilipes]